MLVTGEEGKDLPGEESDKSKGLHTGKDRVYSGNTGRCGVRWSWLDYGDAWIPSGAVWWLSAGFGVMWIWAWILPFLICATMGQIVNFWVPQFLLLQNGNDNFCLVELGNIRIKHVDPTINVSPILIRYVLIFQFSWTEHFSLFFLFLPEEVGISGLEQAMGVDELYGPTISKKKDDTIPWAPKTFGFLPTMLQPLKMSH